MSWPFHQHDSFPEHKKVKAVTMDMCKTAEKKVIVVIQRARDSQWK